MIPPDFYGQAVFIFYFFLFYSFQLSFPCGRLCRLMSAFERTLKQHLVSYRVNLQHSFLSIPVCSGRGLQGLETEGQLGRRDLRWLQLNFITRARPGPRGLFLRLGSPRNSVGSVRVSEKVRVVEFSLYLLAVAQLEIFDGGASICSIPFCPFPFSCPTKSAVHCKKRHDISYRLNDRTNNDNTITLRNHIPKNTYFPDRGVRTPLMPLVWSSYYLQTVSHHLENTSYLSASLPV